MLVFQTNPVVACVATVLLRCANKPRWAKVGGARVVKLPQANPVGLGLFSHVNAFFCSHKFA